MHPCFLTPGHLPSLSPIVWCLDHCSSLLTCLPGFTRSPSILFFTHFKMQNLVIPGPLSIPTAYLKLLSDIIALKRACLIRPYAMRCPFGSPPSLLFAAAHTPFQAGPAPLLLHLGFSIMVARLPVSLAHSTSTLVNSTHPPAPSCFS